MDSTLSHKFKLSAKQINNNTTNIDRGVGDEETSLHIGILNDPEVTVHKELTEIKQDEDGIKIDGNKVPHIPQSPYDDITPTHILQRMYKVLTLTLTDGDITFFTISKLLQQKAVKRVMSMFSLARFGVKVKLVMRSVPQQYGVILFSAMPWVEQEASSTDVWFWPGSANLTVLDISSAQTVEKGFPYHFPAKYMPLQAIYDGSASWYQLCEDMWHFRLGAKMSTVDSTVSNAVQLDVYMSLTDVELAGPLPEVFYDPQSGADSMNRGLNFRNAAASVGTLAATGVAAASYFKQGMDTYTQAKKTASETYKAASEIKSDVESLRGNLTETFFQAYEDGDIKDEEVSPQDGGQTGVKLSPFGDTCTALPDEQVNSLTLHRKSSLMRSDWCGDNSDGHHSILDVIAKPSLIFLESFVQGSFYGGRVDPNFQLYTQSPASNPVGFVKVPSYMCYLSRMFRFWRGGIKILLSFHTTPLITANFRVMIKHMKAADTLTFDGANTPIMVDLGNMYNEVITVRGPTVYAVTVPYLAHQPWTPCYLGAPGPSSGDSNPLLYTFAYLSVTCEEMVKGAGSSAAGCYVLASVAAAEDFEFRQLIAVTPDVTPAIDVKGKSAISCLEKGSSSKVRVYTPQMDLNEEFSKPFRNPFGRDFAPDIYAHGSDRVRTLEHIFARFDYGGESTTIAFGDSIDTEYSLLVATGTGTDRYANGSWIATLFRWWRGSRRMKMHVTLNEASTNKDAAYWLRNHNPYPAIAVGTPEFDFSIANGATGMVPVIWQNIEAEIPFYYSYPVKNNGLYGTSLDQAMPGVAGISIEPDQAGDNAISSAKWYIAAGRDFQLFYLMPVPALERWPR